VFSLNLLRLDVSIQYDSNLSELDKLLVHIQGPMHYQQVDDLKLVRMDPKLIAIDPKFTGIDPELTRFNR